MSSYRVTVSFEPSVAQRVRQHAVDNALRAALEL
jgi:hypothetical protein